MLTVREFGRFLRVLPRRIPGKVRSMLRAVSGKPPYGFPPDDFDQRTGLDTADRVKIHKLDSLNSNYVHAQGYAPVSPQVLISALEAVPVEVSKYTFVDLGCGKGRALFVASQFGIRRIIGVELSPSLVRVARDNVSRWHRPSDIQIICADASEYQWPRESLIVFLYNPFDSVILSRVLENLQASLRAGPRDVRVIYCSPSHRNCFDRQEWLQETAHVGPSVIYRAAL